jgi:hypothetical protein
VLQSLLKEIESADAELSSYASLPITRLERDDLFFVSPFPLRLLVCA